MKSGFNRVIECRRLRKVCRHFFESRFQVYAAKNVSKFQMDFERKCAYVLRCAVCHGQATHFDLFGQATASSQRIQAEKTLITLSSVFFI